MYRDKKAEMYESACGRRDIIEDYGDRIRLAHNAKVENSPKPSMWEYNPKGGMPTELANLDSSKFLTSRLGQILCSLPKDVLIRLCSMLSARDFVRFSMTCRFLHWRMFTFCTCYVPYTVRIWLTDRLIDNYHDSEPRVIYILDNGIIYDENDHDGFSQSLSTINYSRDGKRGLFITQPFCLRKPFFFDTLQVQIYFPFFCKTYYDWCLPYIMAVRGLTRHLDVTFRRHYYYDYVKTPVDFLETNHFLATINTNYYDYLEDTSDAWDEIPIVRNNFNIYMKCPYARQMNRVRVFHPDYRRLNVPVFENRIGIYHKPRNSTIIATLKNFLTGSTSLIFHQYLGVEIRNDRLPLFEYLFEEFGEFEEFLYGEFGGYYHVWKKVITTENGGLLRIIMEKNRNQYIGSLRIGKEEMFDEMSKKHGLRTYNEKGMWWTIETAVESDEVEELNVALSPEESVKPVVVKDSDGTEEPAVVVPIVMEEPKPVAVMSEIVEGSKKFKKLEEAEGSDEAEEEQESSGVCLCLSHNSCSIQ